MLDNLTPGPWFSLPWHVKARLWVRHQPAFKARMFVGWARYFVMWHLRYKHYPAAKRCTCCRRDPADPGAIYVNPAQAWAITVAQDAHGLGRYWHWRAR